MSILTIVSADVDEGRAGELVVGFESLLASGLPDGLLESRYSEMGKGTGRSTRCGEIVQRWMP